ncbi:MULTISPECIES: nitroreductase family protein [unclassified Neptuniibacter]|uniref:nitroreductase family protein n=1 Tax=unclassified Neptuniibacter TaxID=2630693 RepID=UPI000C5E2FF8|nr:MULTISPECIES: nitroreductase family protein [unclassified Neptuniibacter]MAY42426.1 reductase DrgA [Oceanospirillaceae bacterium]|tara:strand:+ start:45552 stop:46154 length:603 start_codon:yes stop_codon:yes gene_type:complete
MELFNAIKERRAVKHYDKESPVSETDFKQIMSAVLLSPTSYNIQHWRFVRVTDPLLRDQIQEAAWGQTQITEAAELIILCADTQAWSDNPQRYWANTPEDVQAMMLPMLESFYNGKEQLQRDEAMRSCGMAAQTLMLSAKALGYDTCPMIGFDNEQVAKIIKLPEHHVISMIVTLGRAAKSANKRAGQLPLEEVLKENSF